MIEVVLVDDHRILREGIRSLAEATGDIRIVGEAEDGRTALDTVAALKPHVVVMDISMPSLNGIDATRRIKKEHPEMRVVALSMHHDERFVIEMFQAGADAYLCKDVAADELNRAIRAVARGETYVASSSATVVVRKAMHPEKDGVAEGAPLTPREREVLQLIAEGKTSGEIAGLLRLSTATVDTHRRNLMRKTGTHSVADLTKLALREGLTALD